MPPTIEERLDHLQDRIDELRTSAGWLAMLAMRRRTAIARYSLNNQLLIWLQYPEASAVAGYREWATRKRQVRKGEKAIWILAPKAWRREGDDGEVERGISGFKPVPVFALEQTDGDPIEHVDEPPVGPCPEGLYVDLVAAAAAGGFEVYSPQPGDGVPAAHGWIEPEARRIAIRPDVEAQMCASLLHELGHGFDPELDVAAYRLDHGVRADAELVAESVAAVVASDIGVDLGGSEIHYLAGWAGSWRELFHLTGRITASVRAVQVVLAEVGLVEVDDA